jgi:hypothetical protein
MLIPRTTRLKHARLDQRPETGDGLFAFESQCLFNLLVLSKHTGVG